MSDLRDATNITRTALHHWGAPMVLALTLGCLGGCAPAGTGTISLPPAEAGAGKPGSKPIPGVTDSPANVNGRFDPIAAPKKKGRR